MDLKPFPEFTRQIVESPKHKKTFKSEGTAEKSERITRKRDKSEKPGDQRTTALKSDGTEPPHKKLNTSILVCCSFMKLH